MYPNFFFLISKIFVFLIFFFTDQVFRAPYKILRPILNSGVQKYLFEPRLNQSFMNLGWLTRLIYKFFFSSSSFMLLKRSFNLESIRFVRSIAKYEFLPQLVGFKIALGLISSFDRDIPGIFDFNEKYYKVPFNGFSELYKIKFIGGLKYVALGHFPYGFYLSQYYGDYSLLSEKICLPVKFNALRHSEIMKRKTIKVLSSLKLFTTIRSKNFKSFKLEKKKY